MVYILNNQWYDGVYPLLSVIWWCISSITSDMVYILYNQWYDGVYPL